MTSKLNINWLNKCRCGNRMHTVETVRGSHVRLFEDDAVKCNSCGREGVIQTCDGIATVLWETDAERAEGAAMTKSTITRERLQEIAEDGFLKHGESKELARMALAAMDSESECLPLDYLQGHKDGLEWAAQLAEANHPETGDWLYDDPIELAKAIRKGPDMPPAQSVADSEPVIVVGDDGGDALSYRRLIQSFEPGTKLYRHAQQPVVPDAYVRDERGIMMLNGVCEPKIGFGSGWNACRAAMIAAAQHDTPALNSLQSVDSVAGKWIPVSERMPEDRISVILWDAEIGEVTSGHYSHKTQTFYHCGDAIENEITHWMPPPCAPQEVK